MALNVIYPLLALCLTGIFGALLLLGLPLGLSGALTAGFATLTFGTLVISHLAGARR